jgi:hypothetical protein
MSINILHHLSCDKLKGSWSSIANRFPMHHGQQRDQRSHPNTEVFKSTWSQQYRVRKPNIAGSILATSYDHSHRLQNRHQTILCDSTKSIDCHGQSMLIPSQPATNLQGNHPKFKRPTENVGDTRIITHERITMDNWIREPPTRKIWSAEIVKRVLRESGTCGRTDSPAHCNKPYHRQNGLVDCDNQTRIVYQDVITTPAHSSLTHAPHYLT